MSKTQRCLSDQSFARFVVALGRNDVAIELPDLDIGMRGVSHYNRTLTVSAGGVRAVEFANDVMAIIEERDALKVELERCKDAGSAKVKCIGGKLTVGRNGVVKIKGGNVEISGRVLVQEVTE